jgi:hypothetical protein
MLDVKDAIKDLRTAIVGNSINGNKRIYTSFRQNI